MCCTWCPYQSWWGGAAFHPLTAEETQKRPTRQIRMDPKAFLSFGCVNDRNRDGIYISGSEDGAGGGKEVGEGVGLSLKMEL